MRIILATLAASLAAGGVPSTQAGDRCDTPGTAVVPILPPIEMSRLLSEQDLRIVSLGSSSTQGVGATSPARTYPAQLEAILERRLPGRTVEVVNKGVGGDTIEDNLRRLGEVLRLRPDLVIWQVGTNDALSGVRPDRVRAELLDGIRQIEGQGAEVVLMDPQPLPAPEKERVVATITDAIGEVARETRTPLFPRHALMRQWLRAGEFTTASLYAGDGLHMTDAGYHCLAEDLADTLVPEVADDVR
jgi:acyl-CoA thioesterase I